MFTSLIRSAVVICWVILMIVSVRPVQSQDIESNPAAADQQIAAKSVQMNRSIIPYQLYPDCPENMPIYRPDDSLTNTMPQIEGNGADPGIFIPKFKQCKPFIQPFKFPEKMGNE